MLRGIEKRKAAQRNWQAGRAHKLAGTAHFIDCLRHALGLDPLPFGDGKQ